MREDYDEAKALKTKLDRLKSFGQRIAELEARYFSAAIHLSSSCMLQHYVEAACVTACHSAHRCIAVPTEEMQQLNKAALLTGKLTMRVVSAS